MIITLAAASVFSIFIVWFVLAPLFSAQNMDVFASSYKGFADEAELNQVLILRDRLIERLIGGTTADQRISELSEGESLDALVSLCLRLQRAELPYLPNTSAGRSVAVPSTEKGSVSAGFLLLSSLIALLSLAFLPVAYGQPLAPQNSNSGTAPAQAEPIESLHILEPGALIPTSNRYVISPAQAQIAVHHVSGFSVPRDYSPATKIVMAVPEAVYDWQIVEMKPEALAKQITITQWNGMPAVQLPAGTGGLVVSLTSQYILRGSSGSVVWKNEKLPSIPGEQIAVLFEIEGVFREIFGSAAEGWNVWPPRLVRPAQGAELSEREIKMRADKPARKVQLVSRQSNLGGPFFSFEIVGLVPSRTPLILLGALVGALLFGVALTVFTRRSRWRIDAPQSLLR